MNIQISGLPENQKIKSINFNIVFDDSNIDTNTTTSTQEPKYSVETIKSKPTITTQPIVKQQEVKEEIHKPEEIDISQRVAKIDPNMLDETF